MTIVTNGVVVLGITALLVGCGGKKKAEDGQSGGDRSARSAGDRSGSAAGSSPSGQEAGQESGPDSAAQAAGESRICIDLKDLQMEQLDLEGLQDELPPVDLQQGLGAVLDKLAGHGTPIPTEGDRVVVPAVQCESQGCKAGVLVIESPGGQAAGEGSLKALLPGLDGVDASTELEFVVALADIDSDGTSDLWIGYHRRDEDASSYQVAALSLPAMTLQWHAVVARGASGDDAQGCEGELYPADANCDGRGDLVLVERCGPMRCLGDEGDGNPGCESGAVTEKASVYLWDGQGKYARSPAS